MWAAARYPGRSSKKFTDLEMCARLPLIESRFVTMPGKEEDLRDCRKPKPGMLLRAASELKIELQRSWMVGDRWRDIDCGHLPAVRTIFIDCGYA